MQDQKSSEAGSANSSPAVAETTGIDSSNQIRSEPHASAVLEVLEHAQEEMRREMLGWHRSIVCKKPMDRRFIQEKGAMAGAFSEWLELHRGKAAPLQSKLLSQPAFDDLARMNTRIFSLASGLAGAVARGAEIKTAQYDALINQVNQFNDLLQVMRSAFQKAVAEIDPLTGLHNRTVMVEELDREYQRDARTDADWCIALSDIDFFKKVNDTYGHAAGDVVLASTAGRFLSCLRPYDTIYRYGGEEFLISLPNANLGTANSVLERLRFSLEESAVNLKNGKSIPVTASFGLARVDFSNPLNVSIERADQALYASKQNGRNRITTWSSNLGDEVA